jgi:ubiquinone biosynthesis protein COQ4
MESHGFDADERPNVRFMTDPDLAYVIIRYRQIHDFWHVLCDLPPTVQGEIALKWFEWRVTGLPSCGLSALIGPLRLSLSDTRELTTRYLPWAIRSASRCNDLMSFMYEENLHVPLGVVRQQLNIEPFS